MAISGRFFSLALAATLFILLFPSGLTWLIVALVLICAATVDLLLAAPLQKLSLSRQVDGSLRLGEKAQVILRVLNNSSRTLRGQVRDGWQPSAEQSDPVQKISVRAGERVALRSTLAPTRRGDIRAVYATIRSFGPLGLAARQGTLPVEAVVRVLPPFNSKRHLPSKLRKLRELDGKAAVQIRGAGTEFDSLRDYVRGDDVRSIDWRATARRQDVVVRTWRPERDRRVIMVIDTSRTSAARIGDEPRLDTSIEAALLLGVLAERGGDRVSLLAYDRQVRARVSAAGRGAILNSMVQALAPVEAELIELDTSEIPSQVRSLSAHRSLVVLLTSIDAGADEEGLIPLVAQLSKQHVVVVASVRDPDLDAAAVDRSSGSRVYRAAAAEHALNSRAAVAAILKQYGAEVVDAPPHLLPPELADTYIRLKAAGRL